MKKQLTLAALLGAALVVAGCGRRGEDPATTAAPVEVPPALAAVFAEVPADGPLTPIPELRRSAGPGDPVVLEAKVMGTERPFVDHRALFVVGDEGTLTSCDIRHGAGCDTPWDNCCDEPAALRAGTATIQVVDETGKVLRHGIKGIAGLKELSRLRIAGVVAPHSTEEAFLINATTIQVL
jgi:hypothetical protein